jgi:quercetin dioxygenase-like cupin family protein
MTIELKRGGLQDLGDEELALIDLRRVKTFRDERGTITDLVAVPGFAVTEIVTVKGAVRGNHFHKKTWQSTYLISGRLLVVTDLTPLGRERVLEPGDRYSDPPGQRHAWQALEDSVCVVWAHGPRSGEDYESDTFRLEGDERLIR